MNGYQLTRQWFEWKFNNPGKMSAGHAELYFYIIDRWNYFSQKTEFGLPRVHTMEVLSIGSHNTYKKLLNDLVANGFVKIIRESSNQYHHTTIIGLSKIDIPFSTPLETPTETPSEKASDTIDNLKNYETNESKEEINSKPEAKPKKKPRAKKTQFVPPTFEQVESYFHENGASTDLAERCYFHYKDLDWHNKFGKKLSNWKTTVLNNWILKNQNKEQTVYVPPPPPAQPARRSRPLHESYTFNS